jgi:hypothetical protein
MAAPDTAAVTRAPRAPAVLLVTYPRRAQQARKDLPDASTTQLPPRGCLMLAKFPDVPNRAIA